MEEEKKKKEEEKKREHEEEQRKVCSFTVPGHKKKGTRGRKGGR